jgi:xylulokinase
MSLLGIDIGTTGCKAIVFREGGAIIGAASREYGILTPRPGWAEQDAEVVWRLAWDALCEAVASAPGDPPAALSLSCQGEAVAPVDANNRPLRPMLLGMDTRTVPQNRWLDETLGREWLFERTGMPVHTINTLPKLLWLREHEPETFSRAERFLLYEDLLLARLSGEPIISHCLASRTQMYELRAGHWDGEILAACGLDSARLAPLAPLGLQPVGRLRAELAAELGVYTPIWVAAGGHDQACAALGSGTITPGAAMVSTGTAEVVEVALSEPSLAPELGAGGISIYRHVAPGLFLAMTLNQSGGFVLRWFRDQLGKSELAEAQRRGVDAYDLLLADAPAGPTSLLMLPHLSGSGTPLLDTASRGVLSGLSFATTSGEIAKAILEGLCFELRANTDLLQAAGVAIAALHAVGGGARSPLWLQLKADICGLPLRVPRVTEAACLGAALLAGTVAGVYSNLVEAVAVTVSYAREVMPEPQSNARYEERYQLYRELYPRLADLLHRL